MIPLTFGVKQLVMVGGESNSLFSNRLLTIAQIIRNSDRQS